MWKLIVFVLINLIINSNTAAASTQSDAGFVSQILEFFSISEPVHTMVFDDTGENQEEGVNEDNNSFTDEEIQNLRDIMKFVHGLKGTPVGDILEHGNLPIDLGLEEDMTFTSILRELETDIELREIMTDKFLQGFAEIIQNYPDYESESIDKFDDAEEGEQIDGWEGCRRDYNALALPFTNGLLDRVARAIVDEQLPIENKTCVETCRMLCEIVLERSICLAACTPAYVCNNEDSIATTIDLVMRYYFPPKNMSRWNWAMFDAMAKIPPGVSHGQLHWSGSYQKCPEISVNYIYEENINTSLKIIEARQFTGQFYRLAFKPQPFVNRSLSLLFATCVPSTCSEEHVARYITEENVLFKVLLGRILKWELDEEKTWSGVYEILDEDMAPVVIFLILMFILLILNVLAMCYDITFREKIMEKKLAQMTLSQSGSNIFDIMSQQEVNASDNSYTNLNYTEDKKVEWDLPDSYHPVHAEDKRRFSVSSDNTSDNFNNNNKVREKPTFARSVSAQSASSVRPLFREESFVPSLAQEKPSISERLEVAFVGFSTYSNMHRVTRTDRYEGYLPTIDSVRFLSLAWAFLGYTWLLGPVYAETWITANIVWAVKTYPRKWIFQPILNFHFCSDSFLLISGILVAYHWLRRYSDGKEKVTWKSVVFFYLHRYWRIIPGLAMILLLFTSTYKWLSSGPFSSKGIADAENCKFNWWTNMLLLHNLVNTEYMCLAWTFMIPIVFQLIIMSPMILVPLVLKPLIGYIILVAFYIIHIGTTWGVAVQIRDGEAGWLGDYFLTPWCRAGPFLIGMGIGLYLYKFKCKLEIPKWLVAIGWVLALALITTCTYSTYSQFKEGGERWSESEIIAYNTLARSAWALGVGWIIVASTAGQGGFIGEALNWTAFQPLSRMSYSVTLFSAMLIFSRAYSIHSPLIITTKRLVHMFLSNLVMSYLAAVFLIIIMFHYPLSLGLERAFTVKTKLDCIRAGKHPQIPKSLSGEQSEAPASSPTSGSMPYKMNNVLQRLDSIDEGYEGVVLQRPNHINRQKSVTSM